MLAISNLTPKQRRFVDEYLIDLNATQAARRAGYSSSTAKQAGAENLARPTVRAAIDLAIGDRSRRTAIDQDGVLKRLWNIATANPNDLIAHRIGSCRYCHGIEHDFQWRTQREYEAAVADSITKNPDTQPPTCDGGFGYDITKAPDSACPECNGLGNSYVHAADTAALQGAAALLYDGVKQTRDGIEIKLQDRAKALEMVARHLGMFNDKLTLKGDAENPLTILLGKIGKSALPVVETPPADEDDEALAA